MAAYRQTHSPSLSAWSEGRQPLSLHSSNKPSELSQWPWHDDSTINIGIRIVVIVLQLILIVIIIISESRGCLSPVCCLHIDQVEPNDFKMFPDQTDHSC